MYKLSPSVYSILINNINKGVIMSDRKEQLKDQVAEHLELALSALYKDWPETTRLHIEAAEKVRHEWDALLVEEQMEVYKREEA